MANVNDEMLVPVKSPAELKREFEQDNIIIAEQTSRFVETMQPAYMLTEQEVRSLVYDNSAELLDAVTFFKIKSCSTDNADEVSDYLCSKMNKFYTAIHSLNKTVIYGVVAYGGDTSLVVGVYADKTETEAIKKIMQGLLDGVELEDFKPGYAARKTGSKNVGFISGVPSAKIAEEKQSFDIGPVMKSLNGQNYTLLFISRPVSPDVVSSNYGELIQIRDECFSVSKRNLSRQHGTSHSTGNTEGTSETQSHSTSKTKGGSFGISFILSFNKNWSKSTSDSYSSSKNFSKTITDAVNDTSGESHDIQNGFALEMMEYADKAIERLRQGKSNGMWETVITYSAENSMAKQILEACVNGELAKPNPDLLPAVSRSFVLDDAMAINNPLLIPKILKGESAGSKLCTHITSEELGFISTPPSGAVPNFEVRIEKAFPLVVSSSNGIVVGNLHDGVNTLDNMPFALSKADLARHTFVCGITGSGKTTTVKRILTKADTPFLVIESAKTEYRNIRMEDGSKPIVYTLGRPEINCISMNPFYIQNGVSPMTHIDLLKDLFNASFSFYGPMPYILEKCLHNVYKQKGWNLTLGYHPYLANTRNVEDFFDAEYVGKNYEISSHKYLFPTMQDLKDEIKRYIEEEMNYEGEVAGNIKTAIKARLENLCSGSKGFMFNTHEAINMQDLLNANVVFELEGLADDSDKAFAVGLMVIFINEYRQTQGKRAKDESPLAHLLVIEEAHRLLKNTSTEKTSEDMGNPKGKAVEHFTNMIAEMRSYGQGVIVAEQIPSKLAPDVIKNSSNKIVQRLVALDDQTAMANTIGIDAKDAMQLGSLRMGEALCHKEGMVMPVTVKIIPTEDVFVTDGMLYDGNLDERIHKINMSILNEAVGNKLSELTIKLVNSLLIQDVSYVRIAIEKYRGEIKKAYLMNGVSLVTSGQERNLQSELMARDVEKLLMRGIYRVKGLVTNELENELYSTINNPTEEHLREFRELLKKAYDDDPVYKGCYFVAMLIVNQYYEGMNIRDTVKNYFVQSDEKSVDEILNIVKEG